MKRMNPEKPFQVDVTEHDRWSGPSTDTEEYATREQADARIKEINSKNTAKEVPEYYLTATACYK